MRRPAFWGLEFASDLLRTKLPRQTSVYRPESSADANARNVSPRAEQPSRPAPKRIAHRAKPNNRRSRMRQHLWVRGAQPPQMQQVADRAPASSHVVVGALATAQATTTNKQRTR